MLITLAIVAVLIVANGLFVAAEFAIVGAPRAAVQARAAMGDRRARRVAAILADPVKQDRFIATAQLGITLASLGLGMYGEHAVAEWILRGFDRAGWLAWAGAHAMASTLAITALTYLHVVIGEMVPKSLALQHAEATADRVATPMTWMQRALKPLVLGLNGIGNGVLRLFGVDRRDAIQHYTPDELEAIVDESLEGGRLEELPGQLMQGLFDFFELTAEQVMVPRVHVVGVPLGAGREELAEIVGDEPHTRYPVFERDLDHILGFVHAKDLARQVLTGGTVDAELARPAAWVPGSMALDRVLETMRAAGGQLAVVLDEHGGTAGILTVEDLFEELVGELDEDARAQPGILRLGDDALLADGTVRLDEVGEAFGDELEHEEVDTVSGLVLDLLGRPPVPGDTVTWEGLELTVVTAEGRGVGQCRIRRVSTSGGAS